MDDTIVLYPCPGRSHLVSMVELGKLILTHDPSFSITVIVSDPPFETVSTAPYISAVSATTPSISFHHLPAATLTTNSYSPPDVPALLYDLAELNNPSVHKALLTLSKSSNIKAFVIDFFCNAAFQISSSLNIPTYYYFTQGANGLAVFLYFPTFYNNTTKSFKELDMLIDVPGTPTIPSKDMPETILDRTTKIYPFFFETAIQMPKSAGLIANTFESLEQRAIKALLDGQCVLAGEPMPPLYCIGPLIAANDHVLGGEDENECLSWLNSQPSRSVVYLSFGSMGLFSSKQLKEIAIGLEKSGVRFLWVVRTPPPDDEIRRTIATAEPSLELFLPEGFLERTKDWGFVVKFWAPQVAVLNHDSVAGFVSHCGWNSVLEAVCAGVPMLAWPLYAEQKLNRVILVEEMKIALSVDESEDGFVSATVLEERVTELMKTEKGEAVRERAMALKNEAAVAVGKGGSSLVALAKLTESLKRERVTLDDSHLKTNTDGSVPAVAAREGESSTVA